MRRIGIASRLTLIVVGCLIVVQILMVSAYYVDRRHAAPGATFAPLLGQIAALTQLIDSVPSRSVRSCCAPRRELAFFRAFARTSLPTLPHHAISRSGDYDTLISDSDARFVALSLLPDNQVGNEPSSRFRSLLTSRLHAVIGLKSGGYLEVQATGDLTMRLLGLPVGLIAGLLGFLVAIARFWLSAARRNLFPTFAQPSRGLARPSTLILSASAAPRIYAP